MVEDNTMKMIKKKPEMFGKSPLAARTTDTTKAALERVK